MGYDRLCGVLVAQQKVVPDERFADQVSGERGRRVGFESHRICLYSFFYGGYRQVVKASGCDSDMRRFDPDYPPQGDMT